MTASGTQLTPLNPLAPTTEQVRGRPASLWRDTLGSILRQRSAAVGVVILAFLVLVALFAPVIATHDPNESLLGNGYDRIHSEAIIFLTGTLFSRCLLGDNTKTIGACGSGW